MHLREKSLASKLEGLALSSQMPAIGPYAKPIQLNSHYLHSDVILEFSAPSGKSFTVPLF
jgi:hypothetical protein